MWDRYQRCLYFQEIDGKEVGCETKATMGKIKRYNPLRGENEGWHPNICVDHWDDYRESFLEVCERKKNEV